VTKCNARNTMIPSHKILILGRIKRRTYITGMRSTGTDYPAAWCVSQSVCLPRGCAVQKTAKRIEMLFEVNTLTDPRHIVLDGGPGRPTVK